MRAHFGGSSRQSLKIARAKLDFSVKDVEPATASQLSTDLFFAAEVIASSLALRRAITDPARDIAAKVTLVKEIFGKTLKSAALEIVMEVSSLRWSLSGDLLPVIEQLAIEAEASAANIQGELDRVEDEFFTVAQAIASSFELRKALTATSAQAPKSALVAELLSGAGSASTLKLVTYLVNNLRGRSIESALSDYAFALAARRNRVIALVRVAVELSAPQRERLAAALTKQIGQPVRVNIEIDSSIIGGVSVKFADELVDGTISRRLAGAGRALVGQSI